MSVFLNYARTKQDNHLRRDVISTQHSQKSYIVIDQVHDTYIVHFIQ